MKNKNRLYGYTMMSNEHLREKEMSLKAKGLFSLMLSLPEDWNYSINGLCKICKENKSAIKSALSELKDFGYLDIVMKLPNETESGRIEYEYRIFQHPVSVKERYEKEASVFQAPENRTQINKEEIIKKIPTKEKENHVKESGKKNDVENSDSGVMTIGEMGELVKRYYVLYR